MNKNLFTVCAISAVILMAGCQSGEENKNTESQSGQTKTDTVAKEPERNNVSLLYDFNALELLFDNQNWMVIDKKDTSFFYVSRVSPLLINTYSYKISKGDSTNSVQMPIQADKESHILMGWQNQHLQLSFASNAKAVWTVQGSDSSKYEFQKLDDNRIRLQLPDGKQLLLQKTHQISLFLVRSRYDYLNGTKLAFDSTQFNKKR